MLYACVNNFPSLFLEHNELLSSFGVTSVTHLIFSKTIHVLLLVFVYKL